MYPVSLLPAPTCPVPQAWSLCQCWLPGWQAGPPAPGYHSEGGDHGDGGDCGSDHGDHGDYKDGGERWYGGHHDGDRGDHWYHDFRFSGGVDIAACGVSNCETMMMLWWRCFGMVVVVFVIMVVKM